MVETWRKSYWNHYLINASIIITCKYDVQCSRRYLDINIDRMQWASRFHCTIGRFRTTGIFKTKEIYYAFVLKCLKNKTVFFFEICSELDVFGNIGRWKMVFLKKIVSVKCCCPFRWMLSKTFFWNFVISTMYQVECYRFL